jgi:hypothetical protein
MLCDLPTGVVARVLDKLEESEDRMSLARTCTTMRRAVAETTTWPRVTVHDVCDHARDRIESAGVHTLRFRSIADLWDVAFMLGDMAVRIGDTLRAIDIETPMVQVSAESVPVFALLEKLKKYPGLESFRLRLPRFAPPSMMMYFPEAELMPPRLRELEIDVPTAWIMLPVGREFGAHLETLVVACMHGNAVDAVCSERFPKLRRLAMLLRAESYATLDIPQSVQAFEILLGEDAETHHVYEQLGWRTFRDLTITVRGGVAFDMRRCEHLRVTESLTIAYADRDTDVTASFWMLRDVPRVRIIALGNDTADLESRRLLVHDSKHANEPMRAWRWVISEAWVDPRVHCVFL